LFSAVIGQELGKAMGQAMNLYALGKAQRAELDNLRAQIAKCGDNCSDELKNNLNDHLRTQAGLESAIDDVGFKHNIPLAQTRAWKAFLSIEPAKLTPEEKKRIDIDTMKNIIKTYCYTISDQIPAKQERCQEDTPYQIARDMDIFINNMCKEKVSKEVGLNVRDNSLQFNDDREVVRKYNGALGAVNECFQSASYYYEWTKSVYKNCNIDWNEYRNYLVLNPADFALWCIPHPTDKAHDYKLLSSETVEFKSAWLNPYMWKLEATPNVLECIYGGPPDEHGRAKFYFWPQQPPRVLFRNSWGGAASKPLSDEGSHGEKFAYDLRADGHYLGLRVVDKCPADLEKAIRLRQQLIGETMPSSLADMISKSRAPRTDRRTPGITGGP
jgi:hypothetical protein